MGGRTADAYLDVAGGLVLPDDVDRVPDIVQVDFDVHFQQQIEGGEEMLYLQQQRTLKRQGIVSWS